MIGTLLTVTATAIPAGQTAPTAPRLSVSDVLNSRSAGTVAQRTSFTREAAPWLLVSGPIVRDPPSSAPVPTLDRAVVPLENMTRPEEPGISPTMIAAGVVALGVAGLVLFKLRKKR